MSEAIDINTTLQIANGPTVALTDALSPDAFAKGGCTIKNGGTAEVALHPVTAEDPTLLAVYSSAYDPQITYAIDGGASGVLDHPLVLIGGSAVKLLFTGSQTLKVTNGTKADVELQWLLA